MCLAFDDVVKDDGFLVKQLCLKQDVGWQTALLEIRGWDDQCIILCRGCGVEAVDLLGVDTDDVAHTCLMALRVDHDFALTLKDVHQFDAFMPMRGKFMVFVNDAIAMENIGNHRVPNCDVLVMKLFHSLCLNHFLFGVSLILGTILTYFSFVVNKKR